MIGCAAWCQWVPTASYQYVADCENCGHPYAGHPQTPQPVAAAKDFCIKASTCDECCNLPDSYCVQQECWMCQADKTSANCANCWAQKCMPQCTECYHSAAPTAVVESPGQVAGTHAGTHAGYRCADWCRWVPVPAQQYPADCTGCSSLNAVSEVSSLDSAAPDIEGSAPEFPSDAKADDAEPVEGRTSLRGGKALP